MNRPESSKFVPGLPDDDDIDTPTNSDKPDSTKIYDGVADCTMNDADTLKSVKLRAKDLAIQKVQQKIADYVYSFWRDRYLTLPDDEVLSIANEICTITDVKFNMQDSDGDKMIIRATVLAQIDDNDVMNYIIQFFKERNELKIQNESLHKEIEDLKQQIANNQQNTSQVIDEDKIALANQKYEEADELSIEEDYEGAIKLYNEAIKLNPNDAGYYNDRGNTYSALGQYERAIQDFDKAIELSPNYSGAYNNRGTSYSDLGQNERAIQDYDKAIQLNPNDAGVYFNRSNAYKKLGKKSKAEADYAKYDELIKKG